MYCVSVLQLVINDAHDDVLLDEKDTDLTDCSREEFDGIKIQPVDGKL